MEFFPWCVSCRDAHLVEREREREREKKQKKKRKRNQVRCTCRSWATSRTRFRTLRSASVLIDEARVSGALESADLLFPNRDAISARDATRPAGRRRWSCGRIAIQRRVSPRSAPCSGPSPTCASPTPATSPPLVLEAASRSKKKKVCSNSVKIQFKFCSNSAGREQLKFWSAAVARCDTALASRARAAAKFRNALQRGREEPLPRALAVRIRAPRGLARVGCIPEYRVGDSAPDCLDLFFQDPTDVSTDLGTLCSLSAGSFSQVPRVLGIRPTQRLLTPQTKIQTKIVAIIGGLGVRQSVLGPQPKDQRTRSVRRPGGAASVRSD